MFDIKIAKTDSDKLAHDFIEMIFLSGEVIKGTPTGGDKLIYYKQEFLNKFLQHFLTVTYLRKDTFFILSKEKKNFYDMASINVIIRSALETYLTFFHIYTESSDDDVIYFRFWSWWRNGLMIRQKFIPIDDESIIKLQAEKKEIIKIQKDLQQNKAFESLYEKQKKDFINTGKWRYKTWKVIAESAGFSKFISNQIYTFLSGYVHTGSASLLQIAQLKDREEAKNLNTIIFQFLFMSCSLFLRDFKKAFPKTKFPYTQYQNDLLDTWLFLAQAAPGG